MNEEFDPVRILRVLRDEGVQYVLIGGFAASLRGSPLLTGDLDVCYARDAENLERLARALRAMHATLRGVDDEVPFRLDARTLQAGDSFTFDTDWGPVDVLGTPSGTRGFNDLDGEATDERVTDDLVIRVVSLDDLMRMKRASGRTKDRVALEYLTAIREELDRPDRR